MGSLMHFVIIIIIIISSIIISIIIIIIIIVIIIIIIIISIVIIIIVINVWCSSNSFGPTAIGEVFKRPARCNANHHKHLIIITLKKHHKEVRHCQTGAHPQSKPMLARCQQLVTRLYGWRMAIWHRVGWVGLVENHLGHIVARFRVRFNVLSDARLLLTAN